MEPTAENICQNCKRPLPSDVRYCSWCGQKDVGSRVSIGRFIVEFFGQLFDLDSRFFRTAAGLFVPGKLTLEYFAGRRIRYLHPLRIFIISGVVLLALAGLLLKNANLEAMQGRWEGIQQSHFRKQAASRLDSLSDQLRQEYPVPPVPKVLDNLRLGFTEGGTRLEKDSISLNTGIAFDSSYSPDEPYTMRIAVEDILTMKDVAIADKYGVTKFWERLFLVQNIRVTKAGAQMVFYTLGNAIWMFLLMIPMLALVLKLLYIRRGFYLVEHVLFALHSHAFLFWMLSFSLALVALGVDARVLLLVMLLMAVYLLLGMKRFYRQAWMRTVLKFLVVNFLYVLILSVAFVSTAILSFLLF